MTISIIGSGMIVGEVLAMLSDELPHIKVRSIYAHSNLQRARQLADDFGIERVYCDYDALLREDTADYIYIANVNTAHYAFARKALNAGRNVIVEKPICMTYEETRSLVTIAEEKKLFFIEAVSLLHMPNMTAIREALPSLGKIKLVHCDYSQYSSRYDRYLMGDVAPAFNPDLGGGALRDLNVYNINFVVSLFGRPDSVEYKANRGYNGIDTSGILLMTYPDFQCVCSAAKDSYGKPYASIQGDKGILYVDGAVNTLRHFTVTARDKEGRLLTVEHEHNTFRHRLAHEFEEFRMMLEKRDFQAEERYQNISLEVMRCVTDALSAV
jgi:predicted dehydrogenase